MMNFLEEVFPVPISVGSSGGPSFSTDVDETEAGYEYRNINWSQAKHKYNVATGIGDAESWAMVKDFFMRCFGRAYAFRFEDPGDNTSAPDGWSDPSHDDQIIGVGDGTTKKFGLVKAYIAHSREILKPQPDTVRISIDDDEVMGTWACDPTTGIVTFGTAPSVGQVIKAGFRFDVPCRFESDELTASWSDATLVQGNIGIVEIRLRRTV